MAKEDKKAKDKKEKGDDKKVKKEKGDKADKKKDKKEDKVKDKKAEKTDKKVEKSEKKKEKVEKPEKAEKPEKSDASGANGNDPVAAPVAADATPGAGVTTAQGTEGQGVPAATEGDVSADKTAVAASTQGQTPNAAAQDNPLSASSGQVLGESLAVPQFTPPALAFQPPSEKMMTEGQYMGNQTAAGFPPAGPTQYAPGANYNPGQGQGQVQNLVGQPQVPTTQGQNSTSEPPPQVRGNVPPSLCSNCRSNLGTLWCQVCSRPYCRPCDQAIHSNPPYYTHTRVPLGDSTVYHKFCISHPGRMLEYFCETCSTPVCGDCRVYGSHPADTHYCVLLSEGYRLKMGQLQDRINMKLLSKRDMLMQKTNRIQQRMAEVKAAKQAVERQLKAELQSNLNKINQIEASKLRLLQQQLDGIQREFLDIRTFMEQICSVKDGFLLLWHYKEWAHKCDSLSHREMPPEPHVPTDDFALLLSQSSTYEESDRRDSLQHVKDNVVRTLLAQQQQAKYPTTTSFPPPAHSALEQVSLATARLDLSEKQERLHQKERELSEARSEMDRWIQLSNQYHRALSRFKLACTNCGQMLEPEVVNGTCPDNTAPRGGPVPLRRHYFMPV
eukprot:GFYU01003120.1.p1 GENE.GFYU01003120.1~~GFYU01003120.1.p1  ORF type:complete len:613 (-),score=58.51 GFYU01003120.1:272-2110(-)